MTTSLRSQTHWERTLDGWPKQSTTLLVEKELSVFEKQLHSVIFIGPDLKKAPRDTKLKSVSTLKGNRDWMAEAVDDSIVMQYMRAGGV